MHIHRAIIGLAAMLLLVPFAARAQSVGGTRPQAKQVVKNKDRKPANTRKVAVPATTGSIGHARQQPQSPQTVTTGWRMSCGPNGGSDQLLCEVANSVVIAKLNQRFMSLAVRKDPTTKKDVLVVVLPHGVLLTSPITAAVDGKASTRFAPLTTDQNGLYATLAIAPDLAKFLASGKSIKVSFDGSAGQRFAVDMSLQGFAAMYGKMAADK